MALGWSEGDYGVGFFGEGGVQALVSVTGVVASGSVGVEDVSAGVTVSPTGVVGTFAEPIGLVGISDEVSVSGVIGSGAVETAAVQAKAEVSPTGVEASGAVGTVTTRIGVFVTGVSATGELGEEIAPDFRSWGGGAWGEPLGWGGVLTVDELVTGVEATGTVGTVSEVIGGTNVVLTGVAGTGELGEEDVLGKANVSPTGVSASGLLGTLTMSGKAIVDVTGVVGAVGLGSVTTRTVNNFAVTGVQADMALGEVEIQGEAVVILVTGVSATGQVSRPLVWGLIDTGQTPNWLPIAA